MQLEREASMAKNRRKTGNEFIMTKDLPEQE